MMTVIGECIADSTGDSRFIPSINQARDEKMLVNIKCELIVGHLSLSSSLLRDKWNFLHSRACGRYRNLHICPWKGGFTANRLLEHFLPILYEIREASHDHKKLWDFIKGWKVTLNIFHLFLLFTII